jgi:trehalose 6-phosphate phosphatase
MEFYEMVGFVAGGCAPLPSDVPAVAPEEGAFFFDFDGVLCEIAAAPDAITVAPGLQRLISLLDEASGGAVAIVSGRPVADLRRWLPEVTATLVGGHGAELQGRGSDTTPQALCSPDPKAVAQLHTIVSGYALSDEAYLAEPKPTGIALHFRRKPELDPHARQFLERVLRHVPGFHLHAAKMAYEVRPDGVAKDHVVCQLLASAPFAGRKPVYFGDDLTDEPALAHIAHLGGIAVKVGEGPTHANYRVAGPRQVQDWLRRSLALAAREAEAGPRLLTDRRARSAGAAKLAEASAHSAAAGAGRGAARKPAGSTAPRPERPA